MLDDWVLGEDDKYTYDPSVTSKNDPNLGDREYIGKSVNDVFNHYAENNSISNFFGGKPEFGDISSWPGEISTYENTMADNWAEGNMVKKTIYETVNSFSIVFQSMNPFDDNVTTLRGENLNGTDRSEHGANVAATLMPIGAAKTAGYGLNFRYYANAKGVGMNVTKHNNRLLGMDWHKFKIGGKKTGTFINRPHIDIPNKGVKHWPWHQLDKWKRGVK